nr:CDP-paratose synthetase - Yersinia pseudotuberculosis (fragments) [Yersinia pseudotuberculosis]
MKILITGVSWLCQYSLNSAIKDILHKEYK